MSDGDMVRFLEEHGIGKPPERDDLMDMASECSRLNVKIERLTKERDEAKRERDALLDLAQEWLTFASIDEALQKARAG
jgi:hypothetical protein